MLPAPFHEMIETLRRRSGISHDQLSHRAWTSPGYTHRICSGKSKPGRDMVIRLGLALNMSVETLDEVLRAAGHPGLLDIAPGEPAPAGRPQPHP